MAEMSYMDVLVRVPGNGNRSCSRVSFTAIPLKAPEQKRITNETQNQFRVLPAKDR